VAKRNQDSEKGAAMTETTPSPLGISSRISPPKSRKQSQSGLKSGLVVDSWDAERLNVDFREKYCVLFKLLEPALLDVLLSRLEQGEWCEKVHKGVGAELVLDDLLALNVLHFVANSPSFFDAVRSMQPLVARIREAPTMISR
jgi:hypothetical protein